MREHEPSEFMRFARLARANVALAAFSAHLQSPPRTLKMSTAIQYERAAAQKDAQETKIELQNCPVKVEVPAD